MGASWSMWVVEIFPLKRDTFNGRLKLRRPLLSSSGGTPWMNVPTLVGHLEISGSTDLCQSPWVQWTCQFVSAILSSKDAPTPVGHLEFFRGHLCLCHLDLTGSLAHSRRFKASVDFGEFNSRDSHHSGKFNFWNSTFEGIPLRSLYRRLLLLTWPNPTIMRPQNLPPPL